MTITDISIFGADDDISDAIKQNVIKDLEGSYLGMYSKRNSFLYPGAYIVKNIKSTFPRILDVTVDLDSLTQLRVSVSQKVPHAVICTMLPNFDQDNLAVNNDDPCYLADESGYLFEKSPGFSGHPYNIYYAPTVTTHGSTTDIIGQYATTTSEFIALQSFYDAAESAGLSVNGLLIKEAGEYELYASSTIIYFNNEQVISSERDNLVAFWKHIISENKLEKNRPVFDYIDLRYGSNVFYKVIK